MAIKGSAGIGCLDIEINGIPVDWETVKLKEIIFLEYGKGLSERNRERGLFPVVGSNGVVGFHNLALVKGPGIVVGRKGTIGAVSLIELDFWPIDTTYYIRILNKEISLKWLFFALVKLNLPKLSMSDVVPGLKRELVYNLKALLPPLPEQKKIAEILSTADQAIEKVDEATEKTQRLKKGLMQELLTKGIGHKEFKDTEIGRMPKEWIHEVAEKVCSRVTDGTHDTPKPSENGYYLVTSKDIKEGGINFSQTYLISEDDFNEINRRSKVDSYDVLFSMIGTVGQTAIVKDNYPKFAIKNVGLFKTNNSKVLARWLHYYFGSKFAQFYIKNSTKGTTQKYLPLFSLRSFPITVAPLPEQQKITEILSEVDKRLELLREKKGKLEKIKKGLMNDLLTGKRRVRLEE